MAKIYTVKHYYDVDGGFGDAVGREEDVATFFEKADAEEFVAKYSNAHVYDVPYASLECGFLRIVETEVMTHEEYAQTEWKWESGWGNLEHLCIKGGDDDDDL